MLHLFPRAALTLAVASALTPAVFAAEADLKAEIDQLKADYQSRLADLEKRLAGAPKASGSGFNPDISLILQGQYKRLKDIPERGITGFWTAAGHAHDGEEEAEPRGFTLDHSELVLSANVDHYFRGLANFAVADGEVEVEEAWLQTLALGQGFTLKGGRFLSGIGYQNELHPHAWDFADAPLAYQVLFGEHYAQDGVQLKWVAPSDTFVELGAEAGRGANFPGTDRNKNGTNGGALFAHAGGDVGASQAWRAGVSWLATRAEGRATHFEDTDAAGPNEVEGLFTGKSRTWLADVVWKWAPEGNASERHLKLQAEYFRRNESGELACTADPLALPSSPCVGEPLGGYRSRQSGWYAQAVYQFRPAWRVGYRYDRLDSGTVAAGLAEAGVLDAASASLTRFRPQKHSLMTDWSPSEFSRLRLQFARDRSMQGVTDNQVSLQYVMSLGAHGAHRF